MPLSRLSAQDASFLFGEDPRMPLHVGGLGFVEAAPLRDTRGAIDIERIRRAIESRLHLIPIFRRKLAEIPLDQGRPVWIDDPDFRIENHVRLCALPRPGDRRALLELMNRRQQTLLPRDKPLWEIDFVDGLADERRVAILYKVHHSVIDGTAGVEIATLLYDFTREAAPIGPAPWQPEPVPGPRELLAEAVEERIDWAVDSARTLVGSLREPARPVRKLLRVIRALETLLPPIDRLPFNGRLSSERNFETTRLPLARALAVRRAFGVTLNDVVLAAVTGALRQYCGWRGIDPEELDCIRALVPVDNREQGDRAPGCNVASMFVELPIGEPDPQRRLLRIYQRSRTLKRMQVAQGTNLWASLGASLPTPLLKAASWNQFRGLMSHANLLVSHVRGPAKPVYHLGAELEELYPYFGPQDDIGLNIVLLSYNEELMIGLAADPKLLPELSALAEAIPKAFEELAGGVLMSAVNEPRPARPAPPTRKPKAKTA